MSDRRSVWDRERSRELKGFRVARIGGIDLTIHGSWAISLALLTTFAHVFIVEDLLRGSAMLVTVPVALAFAFPIAGCIVAHEFGHCFVARLYGLPVRRITLFAFGGVSQIDREAPGPRTEFHIAIAGPVVSLVLATIFAGISRALNPEIAGLFGVWGAFAIVNFMLAVFNLLPAFPMDGGRILRSALWAVSTRARATRLASAGGRAFGAGLALMGVTLVVATTRGGSAPNGLYIVFMGVFLYMAAGAAGRSEDGDHRDPGSTDRRDEHR